MQGLGGDICRPSFHSITTASGVWPKVTAQNDPVKCSNCSVWTPDLLKWVACAARYTSCTMLTWHHVVVTCFVSAAVCSSCCNKTAALTGSFPLLAMNMFIITLTLRLDESCGPHWHSCLFSWSCFVQNFCCTAQMGWPKLLHCEGPVEYN